MISGMFLLPFIVEVLSSVSSWYLLPLNGPQRKQLIMFLSLCLGNLNRVGDPPAFQGDERDIILLSMVGSPRQAPTQNKVMHAQRVNVALSRARDRMVLVRSVDRQHIANQEDVKHAVLEFFELATQELQQNSNSDFDNDATAGDTGGRLDMATFSFRVRAEKILEDLLKERGFVVRRMGVVWNQALCVEQPGSSTRAGLCIENAGETKEEWLRVVLQQKSIERVGWRCLRVDGLSMLTDHHATFHRVLDFLTSVGIQEPVTTAEESTNGEEAGDILDIAEDADVEMPDGRDNQQNNGENLAGAAAQRRQQQNANGLDNAEVVAISSDEENDEEDQKIAASVPDVVRSHSNPVGALAANDEIDAGQFGHVVQLDFLGGGGIANSSDSFSLDDSSSVQETASVKSSSSRRRSSTASAAARRPSPNSSPRAAGLPATNPPRDDETNLRGDQQSEADIAIPENNDNVGPHNTTNDDGLDEEEASTSSSKRRKHRRRRLDAYSRDGRWHPGRAGLKDGEDNEQEHDWYDTDSDLAADDRAADDKEDEDYEPPSRTS